MVGIMPFPSAPVKAGVFLTISQRAYQSPMLYLQSPLQYLAAFAIAFLAGAISSTCIVAYVQKIKRKFNVV